MTKVYNETLRSFAVTLNFLSCKAYDFVRETFNTYLPHPRTISEWHKTVDGSPGFSTEAIQIIKNKVDSDGRDYVCAIPIDSMAIRKHTEWNRTEKFFFGRPSKRDDGTPATEAIFFSFFFHLVFMNLAWKIPLGYFLVNTIKGEQLHALIVQCSDALVGTKISIAAITFDGHASNLAMAKLLGCKLAVDDMLTHLQSRTFWQNTDDLGTLVDGHNKKISCC